MDLQDLTTEIKKMAGSLLKDESHFIVDVVATLKGNPGKVLVTVDGDKGIGIDECADLSRDLSKVLDETNLIPGAFNLEVSTPGLDQPLKSKRQYVKNIGRNVRVRLADKMEEGKLTTVDDNGIQLTQIVGSGKKQSEKTVEIPFDKIDKTIVLVSFK
jgi:ribosome maturation factor RimP